MKRPALVTGAGQGLGRAFARDLAAAGWPVAVADLDIDRARGVADEIGGLAVAVDVADADSVAAMTRTVHERLGVPEVLVNNAALFSTLAMQRYDEITPEEWARVIAVNLTGAFLCCRALVPGMEEAGYGKVINVSSATIWTGRPGYLHYVSSKAALIGLTRSLASEAGPNGVRVNAITPGSTQTEVPRATISDAARAAMAEQTALRRVQVPEDLVGAVRFLASPESDFITGQTINVDGGFAFH